MLSSADVELCEFAPEYENNVVQQQRVTRTPKNIVFKGMYPYLYILCSLLLYPMNVL